MISMKKHASEGRAVLIHLLAYTSHSSQQAIPSRLLARRGALHHTLSRTTALLQLPLTLQVFWTRAGLAHEAGAPVPSMRSHLRVRRGGVRRGYTSWIFNVLEIEDMEIWLEIPECSVLQCASHDVALNASSASNVSSAVLPQHPQLLEAADMCDPSSYVLMPSSSNMHGTSCSVSLGSQVSNYDSRVGTPTLQDLPMSVASSFPTIMYNNNHRTFEKEEGPVLFRPIGQDQDYHPSPLTTSSFAPSDGSNWSRSQAHLNVS